PDTVIELKARYQDLATRFDVHSDNPKFLEYVADGAPVTPADLPQARHDAVADPSTTPPEQAPAEPQADAPTEQVTGMRLDKVEPAQPPDNEMLYWMLGLLLFVFAAGAVRQ